MYKDWFGLERENVWFILEAIETELSNLSVLSVLYHL